ncbi:hypothetical protein NECAME_04817 [Necator americanus]|uniref:Uncharacterized protein n=1 Tax=Necator americanus TaxID=51031 RepID=W2SMB0_NECAM|nr:hypothetical protein NECAME_04817 [Necator americanus]ETN70804.1 hypothetical protein NECAME_04817 [Necator americanus]
MQNRPSSSTALGVGSAISSLKSVYSSANALNEDIEELLEHIRVVEELPASTNLAMVEGWRSRQFSCYQYSALNVDNRDRDVSIEAGGRGSGVEQKELLTKLRMKMTELELDYRRIVDSQWKEHLTTVKEAGSSICGISFTFANDLRVVDDFFTKAHNTASKNVIFNSNIRIGLPTLTRQVDLAIARLLSDIKTYASSY